MNRLETDFGDDGWKDAPTTLFPFGAYYRYSDRTWSITVWEANWKDAEDYCKAHNLILSGRIVGRMD